VTAAHVVVVPHTHWDREWYRTHEDFRYRLVALLDDLLDLLESDASFRHFTLDGQTILLEDYLAVRPQARERVAALVRAGRLLIGPWYVLPDEWLVSGEALIRNLRMGIAVAEGFGGAMPVGYVPDQFGHVGQLPQLFAGFGLPGAVLWRGVGANVAHTTFHWEAPDGTRMLAVYLVNGYGNGSHLPLDPEALARRIRAEVDGQAARSRIPSVLLMNGGDHQTPQRGLPEALAAAAPRLAGVTAELGTLAGFLSRARDEVPADLALHRGELRSGLRAPLLEGCASSRMPQKRRDFFNDRLLTRYLEPLAAWLSALGGDADPDRIAFAWRVALQNHPHDSICGCSIDAVHAQMETRFARTEEIARAHLGAVTSDLARRIAVPEPRSARRAGEAIVVWNPNASGWSQAEGALQLDVPDRRGAPALHLRDGTGRRIPVHAEVADPGTLFAEYRVPASVARMLVDGFPPEFFGEFARGLRLRRVRGVAVVEVQMGETRSPGFDLDGARRALAVELAALGEREVVYRVRRLPHVRLRFVDELPGCGLRTYRLMRGRAAAATPSGVLAERGADGRVAIQNDVWRVEALPDGTVQWLDRRDGTVTPDALRLVSEADRGDSYNFDPVPAGLVVQRPSKARASLLPASDAEVGIAIDLVYRLPRGLGADRSSRSRRTVALPARVVLRLSRALDRLDIAIAVENRAQDHRLRAHVRAPFAARCHAVESAFEVVERPIEPAADSFGSAAPAERPLGASPQRGFASLGDGARAITLANRGCPEVEAVREPDGRTSLAVTVLRAVGWLSRGDLALRPGHAGPPVETPGAQVPGSHRVELSLRSHRQGDLAAPARARHFVAPPLVFAGAGGQPELTPLADGARLLALDDPAVAVSAIEPCSDGSTIVRLVNTAPEARAIAVRHGLGGDAEPEPIATRGRPLAGSTGRGGAGRIALRPREIAAFRVRRAGPHSG